MRRVMVAAWGKDGSTYAGKRLTLYRDPSIKFGGQAVGGIRISAMSHIDKPMVLALTETRGKKATFKVDVLKANAPTSPAVSPETLAELVATFDRKGVPEDKRLPACTTTRADPRPRSRRSPRTRRGRCWRCSPTDPTWHRLTTNRSCPTRTPGTTSRSRRSGGSRDHLATHRPRHRSPRRHGRRARRPDRTGPRCLSRASSRPTRHGRGPSKHRSGLPRPTGRR